ncbi:hypothetical protein NUW58_g10069 [Xylaria curta]|uniref:Uncharacterized protein n=1 Tax=Xylaria curta TaxID=42375 RepID=A0ACC1MRX6_9PEZI|nr:hypothetical protein NUW58_g10069 [Xylaria curta]
MASHSRPICYVVPPYLLNALAETRAHLCRAHNASRGPRAAAARRNIIPDVLLKHIAESEDVDEETRANAKNDLVHILSIQAKYQRSQGLAAEKEELATLSAPAEAKATYRAVAQSATPS